jgi:hypothetical protein
MPRHRLFVAVAAVLPLLVAPAAAPAHAKTVGTDGLAACVENPVPDLIAQHPKGGQGLTEALARLVAAQPCVADDVIAAAATASPAIAAALAAGLAQGAAALVTTDPATARDIRTAVYQSGDRSFAAAFSVAYSVALTGSPAALASSDGRGLPGYSTPLGNTTVSPH